MLAPPPQRRQPVEDGIVMVDCGPCLRRFRLHRCVPEDSRTVWFVKDICGIICVVMTWLLILYAEYVVMVIMLWPSPSPGYFWGNALLFNCFVFLAIASHSKAMLTDPVSIAHTAVYQIPSSASLSIRLTLAYVDHVLLIMINIVKINLPLVFN